MIFVITGIWYPPQAQIMPIEAGEELVIGSQDDETCLVLGYHANKEYSYAYIKIVVTRERTDFTFFTQWLSSPTEDKVRGMTAIGMTYDFSIYPQFTNSILIAFRCKKDLKS